MTEQPNRGRSHLPSRRPGVRKHLYAWLRNGCLTLLCLIMLYPIVSTLLLSIKEQSDVRRKPPVLLPCDTATERFDWTACRFSWEGYQRVLLPEASTDSWLGFRLMGRILRQYLPNTLLYATFSALLITILAATTAYAVSRYQFRGRHLLLVGILALAGVPFLTMLLGLYQVNVALRRALPLYDERLFMIVVYVGFELPFAIWVVKGFIDSIPIALEEAAQIDGCTATGTLWRIVAPLAAPGLAAIFLLGFVNVWNEFIANYLLMSRAELRGVMYGVYDYIAQSLASYNALAAACVLVMLPIVLVFLGTRNSFFQAMLTGALKG